MSELGRETFHERVGTGGSHRWWHVVTGGKVRLKVSGNEPFVQGEAVLLTPDAPRGVGSGGYFFRDRGDGKSQFCILFPSGAVQILATEP